MLKVDAIDSYYGDSQVLSGISFEVGEKEIVAIVGNNGAGKTTILKSVVGLVHPRRGSILFKGISIEHLPAHKISEMRVSLVPEGRCVFPLMTVLENLELGSHIPSARKQRKTNLEKVFAYFPVLASIKMRAAGKLSGGEQQMLALARGLMSDPELLILDEPSLGLAPIVVGEIFEIILSIHRQGKTILLVEQNTNIALSISDRAYVLSEGRITMQGKGQSLLHDDRVRKAYLGL